jgi:hypothetical protein
MYYLPSSMKLFIVCALAALTDSTLAFHFHVSGRLSPRSASFLRRRNYGSVLNNDQNIGYYVESTIGGGTFQVLVDTGRYVLKVCFNENFLSTIPS